MEKEILNHYLQFGTYSYPGLYLEKLKNELPDDIRDIGLFIRKSIIHRTTLEAGNIDSNADLKYGDMTKIPWHRQPEDDILPTVGAMLTELYRRDPKGFHLNKKEEGKFDWSAQAWLDVRKGKQSSEYYWNAMPFSGLITIAWELFYDFHCLMNSEIIYLHHPSSSTFSKFYKLTKEQLQEIDKLAELMLEPDKNFKELKNIWDTNKEFRLLKGGLL